MSDKILIVDDEPANLRSLERLFRRHYEVLSAASGAEALKLLELHDVALIISDQRMPGLSGIEFLKLATKIREHAVRIILSGYTDEKTLVEAINSGVVYKFVNKPWVPEDLMQTVTRALEHYKSVAAHRESEERFRTFVETTNELIWASNDRFECTYINPSIRVVLGYKPEELLGKSFTQYIHEDDRAGFEKRLAEFIRGKCGWNGQVTRWRRKDGTYRYLESNSLAVLNDAGELTGFRGADRDITERKLAEERLLLDAFYDRVTGLANRALFINHVQMAIERGKRNRQLFAVLFLDLDRFKLVNDSLGHAEGDNLLEQLAQRLKFCFRAGDLVARFGGDEFTILLNEIGEESDALRLAERLQEELKIPFEIQERKIGISASIGIALSTQGHTSAEDMLRDADAAMHHAKSTGKAQYQFFDQKMHEEALLKLKLETDLHGALERGEFCVHYQPVINLATDQLEGFEALVRWEHPGRGLVSPAEFIPAMEESGLIHHLGRWVLHESCRQMRRWQELYPPASCLALSVNLSGSQLLRFELIEQVANALGESNLAPNCLKLEITESHLMEDTETAKGVMNCLRSFGVEFSIDDFGTGYSSLSYLHQLPVSYLKIDRSFVSRIEEGGENDEIVQTIIRLGQNLTMKVVAEGVETIEQVARLKQLSCDFGQGYFFSKPLDAAAAGELVAGTVLLPEPLVSLPLSFFRP